MILTTNKWKSMEKTRVEMKNVIWLVFLVKTEKKIQIVK